MSNDLRFEIAPNGDQLRIVVGGEPAAAGSQVLDRPVFNLPPDQLEQLRRGDAPPQLVQQVTADVSAWLLGAELPMFLRNILGQANAQPIRLAFSADDQQIISYLADVPFELLHLPHDQFPLALHRNVASVTYLLRPRPTKPSALNANNWPLRVLIVHSNPPDLGGEVPGATGIREAILQLRDDLGPAHIQVDVLSRQDADGVVGLPTSEALIGQLRRVSYDILVYLGHGDLQQPAFQDLPPVGVLQLENAWGDGHTSMRSNQLAQLLHERPVPVVLLIGCMTAADVPNEIKAVIPQWMRGSHGVAQALVDSESGVQFAVGMRYRINAEVAARFIAVFFRSLLIDESGNIEAAVRAARAEEYEIDQNPLGWSAPMVFRTEFSSEPMFPLLASSPACPIVARQQEVRAAVWKALAGIKWSWRGPDGSTSVHELLEEEERRLIQIHRTDRASLLLPDRVELRPDESRAILPVNLHGPVDVGRLEGSVSVGGGAIRIESVTHHPALLANGYRLLSSVDGGGQAAFVIQRAGDGDEPLPEGTLFTVELGLGPDIEMAYPVSVEVQRTEPSRRICPGSNVVIVAAP